MYYTFVKAQLTIKILLWVDKYNKYPYNRCIMNYLPEESKKTKKLTDKQQLFLDSIITTNGDLTKAAELAGPAESAHSIQRPRLGDDSRGKVRLSRPL